MSAGKMRDGRQLLRKFADNYPEMKEFLALEVALEAVRLLRGVLVQIKQHDPDLERQARKAANSMVLNLTEGNRRKGKDRFHLFSVSAGSADEVCKALRLAEAWGYLSTQSTAPTLAVLDRFLAIVYRLMHGRR
jgi:four helix bundle protein